MNYLKISIAQTPLGWNLKISIAQTPLGWNYKLKRRLGFYNTRPSGFTVADFLSTIRTVNITLVTDCCESLGV
jgi:hypothetical protein